MPDDLVQQINETSKKTWRLLVQIPMYEQGICVKLQWYSGVKIEFIRSGRKWVFFDRTETIWHIPAHFHVQCCWHISWNKNQNVPFSLEKNQPKQDLWTNQEKLEIECNWTRTAGRIVVPLCFTYDVDLLIFWLKS